MAENFRSRPLQIKFEPSVAGIGDTTLQGILSSADQHGYHVQDLVLKSIDVVMENHNHGYSILKVQLPWLDSSFNIMSADPTHRDDRRLSFGIHPSSMYTYIMPDLHFGDVVIPKITESVCSVQVLHQTGQNTLPANFAEDIASSSRDPTGGGVEHVLLTFQLDNYYETV